MSSERLQQQLLFIVDVVLLSVITNCWVQSDQQ